jgi:hypothetical protein
MTGKVFRFPPILREFGIPNPFAASMCIVNVNKTVASAKTIPPLKSRAVACVESGRFSVEAWLLLRAAAVSPVLYRRLLRESDLFTHLAAQLSYDLPRAIPTAEWSPWAPRSPEVLRPVLDYALDAIPAEALVVETALSWAQWALGESIAPTPLTPAASDYLSGPTGDHVRDFLWQSLPPAGSREHYCSALPHAGVGQHTRYGALRARAHASFQTGKPALALCGYAVWSAR